MTDTVYTPAFPKPGNRKRKAQKLPDPRKEWKKWRDKLDRVFSVFIRQRGYDHGFVECVTCGKFGGWKEMDCGHFIGRQHFGTRWHEKNCRAQCRSCNRFEEGKKYEFGEALKKIYGEGVITELQVAQALGAHKPSIDWLKLQHANYTKLVK